MISKALPVAKTAKVLAKGINPTFDYLVMFFEDLLHGKNNELKNSELYIKELFENNN